jgi:outer membrane protein assembly factor BamE
MGGRVSIAVSAAHLTAAHLTFRRVFRRASFATAVFCLALGGCTSGKWGFPYKASVQQGNWITSEQVALLQPGMTREQVRFALGSPTLTSVLHANQWDYPYYFKPGYGAPTERKFTVYFDSDHLTRWEGDTQPALQPFQIANANPKRIVRDDINTDRSQTRATQTDNGNNGRITPRLDLSPTNDNALNNIPGAAPGMSQPLR